MDMDSEPTHDVLPQWFPKRCLKGSAPLLCTVLFLNQLARSLIIHIL